MQYTSKIALLALALFGTSALAAPLAGEEYEVEAREVEDDLSAREFYDMYLEARADPSLDAREIESMDVEAREYLEYLEARAAASAITETPQTPMTAHSTHVESHEQTHSHSAAKEEKVFLTKHQKAVRAAKKAAFKKFKNVEVYHQALVDPDNKLHHFAVVKYLSKPKNLKKALSSKHAKYHRTAKHIAHHKKAMAYLSHRKQYKKALNHRHHKYHHEAVTKYLSKGKRFQHALLNKNAHFHNHAVYEYLLDGKTRKAAIADIHNEYHKEAVKVQKKLNKLHKKHHKHSSSATASLASASTTATSTPKA